jgi:protein O-GlcNAc transferase
LGASFAARVAASLLTALDLPQRIAPSQSTYEALAISLASEPVRLAEIKRRLEKNRLTSPLFATALTTRYLETAYQQIYGRYHAGLGPDDLQIAPGEPAREKHS